MSDGLDVDVDVVIAGAGPAGVAAAVALAARRPELVRDGRLLCLDKARFPREKPCGGGLTGRARLALDELGLAVRVPAVSCGTGRIVYGDQDRRVTLGRPVDVIRRPDFDADLVAQARDRGVHVVEGEGVESHAVDPARGRVQVRTTSGRTVNARVLVAADGASSRIRDALTAGDPAAPARPLQLFKAEIPAPRPFPPEMIYDFSPMEEGMRGYVWLFPVSGDRLNVGAMHTPSRRHGGAAQARPLGGAQIVRILTKTLARHGVALPAARGWPAWPYTPRGRVAAPHIVCVGDAAGIDALTGEGIAVGLEEGPIAAEAICRALDTGDVSFADYGAAIRRGVVGRELTLDARLAGLLYGRGDARYRFWLSLVMFDRRMTELYAARVCGSTVLADRPIQLGAAFARHAVAAPLRLRRLSRAARALAA